MSDPTKVETPSGKRRPPRAGMGRPKGIPNKTTRAVKEALVEAFENLGGVESLVRWGKSEPGEFYKLWVKVMPTEVKTEVTGADGGAVQTELKITFV